MFEILRKWFEQKNETSLPEDPIRGGGYVHVDPIPSDRLSGDTGSITLRPDGDWRKLIPKGEPQSTILFDTMSCVTFSLLKQSASILNEMIYQGLVPDETLYFLRENGYFINDELNFSEKYTAIMSDTTKTGNSFPRVAHSMRHDGLIPQSKLPLYTGEKSWEEWHRKEQVTDELKKLGKEWKEHIEIEYEWVFTNGNSRLDSGEIATIQKNLQSSPLSIAVPIQASHAILLSHMESKTRYTTEDSYPPYTNTRNWGEKIYCAFRVILTMKKSNPFQFTKTLRRGSIGYEVRMLQEKLGIQIDGNFGPKTREAVIAFQIKNKLTADGVVGFWTRRVLNEVKKLEPSGVKPTIEHFARAIEKFENMKPEYNNPGALRSSPFEIGKKKGYSVFATYEDGWKALIHQITIVRNNVGLKAYKKDGSILDFFKVYAPAEDSNDPVNYATFVSKRLGVDINYKIKDLV